MTGSNLHGTLRFLSKKYCSKRSNRRNSNTIKRRLRASLSTNRNASNSRSDRLQVVVSVGNDNKQRTGEDKTKTSPPELEAAVEKTAEAALANDGGTAKAPDTVDGKALQAKKDEGRKTSTLTTKLLHPEDLAEYQKAEDVQTVALEKIEKARRKVYNDQVQQVWGLYMYGLKHVLALNDLSNAPDAILPGNF